MNKGVDESRCRAAVHAPVKLGSHNILPGTHFHDNNDNINEGSVTEISRSARESARPKMFCGAAKHACAQVVFLASPFNLHSDTERTHPLFLLFQSPFLVRSVVGFQARLVIVEHLVVFCITVAGAVSIAAA